MYANPGLGRDFFTCGHCNQRGIGYATVPEGKLCHPASGLDCYRLVTVYGHAMPCVNELCRASVRRRQMRELDLVVDDVQPVTSES